MIIPMEEPQNRRRHHQPIVLQMRRLLRIAHLRVVLPGLDRARLQPQLHLPPHHLPVEAQVPLAREQAVPDVQPLDGRVVRRGPDVHFLAVVQEVGGERTGDGAHLVLVHLVHVERGVGGFEEFLSDRCEAQGGVRELPCFAWSGLDGRSQCAGEDLVPEADSGEFQGGPGFPEGVEGFAQGLDPGEVGVGVVHAAGDEDRGGIAGDLGRCRDVAMVAVCLGWDLVLVPSEFEAELDRGG